MKNFLLFVCICLLASVNNAYGQYDVLDFEPGGAGAAFTWAVAENDDDPVLEFVANPSVGIVNNSATVAKFTARMNGNPWALTYTDDIDEFEFDATNTDVKIWVYKSNMSNVGLKFEGATAAPIEILVPNTAVNQWQELTFDFSAAIGNKYNRFVIIPDFIAAGPRPADNIVYFDNIQIPDSNVVATPPPPVVTVGAPVPCHDEVGDGVISIFSDTYSNIAGTNYNPGWGQSTTVSYDTIAGNSTLKYSGLNYQGTEYVVQDVSGLDYLHVDFWTGDATLVDFYLISQGPLEVGYPLPITIGEWVSVDIPLSAFAVTVDLTDVFQFKVVGNGDVYFDNLYFFSEAEPMLPVAGLATTITTTDACDYADWTYYNDGAGNPVFAIEWDAAGTGANAAAKNGAEVVIDVAATYTMVDATTDATWSMARYWNVTPGAALVDPVNVKFFYDASEKADIETEMNNDGRSVEAFTWFKTTGVAFDPATHVTGLGVTGGAITLTDMNTGGLMENGALYAQFDGITSFSGGTGTAGVGNTPLPIRLTSFTAQPVGNNILVNWETSMEINNDYFEVERSLDGRTFEVIATVNSRGESDVAQVYETLDRNPAIGANYYRLKQVDFDGTIGYSEVVIASINKSFDNQAAIYPIPVVDQLTIDFSSTASEEVTVIVTNSVGQVVLTQTYAAFMGVNTITTDFTDLPQGSYYIRVQSDSNNFVNSVIKQ